MDKAITISVLFTVLILIDIYIYQAIKTAFRNVNPKTKKYAVIFHWTIVGISSLLILLYNFAIPDLLPYSAKSSILVGLFIIYLSKLFGVIFLLIDDLKRLFTWLIKITARKPMPPEREGVKGKISRSEFLSKAALVSVALPAVTLGFGITSGAHNYRVRKRTIYFPNLPTAFDGIKIAQLSDIHMGSFFNKTAVKGGIDLLLQEKPDIAFFTGDLVNTEAKEVNDYVDIFSKIHAPLGVYSTLGNHDYGDYKSWPSPNAKKKNLQDLFEAHKALGWNLLLNEHRSIIVSGEEIALIGVENWGAGRFSKYGDLKKSHMGTEDTPFKILLSHDPSHWDAQVRQDFKDIDLTFSGHTHGFQFGIEIGDFKWSPSQYLYKQWADLYKEGQQYLYVNRGFGYIGYPGRVGILPEIAIIELRRGPAV